MATPLAAARDMCARLPPGPVLELGCGVGGITRALAPEHQVVAVDRVPGRLAACKENLSALGLALRVELICSDLARPGLRPPGGPPRFAACVLDPDWSPAGAPIGQWTDDLSLMQPPASDLLKLAFEFSPHAVIRLPRHFARGNVLSREAFLIEEYLEDGQVKFVWLHLEQGSIGGVWL
jgi:SAM-dependent methyltransferase